MQDPQERYLRSAAKVLLAVALLAAATATAIHWLAPVHRVMDMLVPPLMCVVFAVLLIALMRRPDRVLGIIRIALLVSGLALVAPSWLYTLQATLAPGVQLVQILPPVSSLFMVLMVMVMVFLPGRQAFRAAGAGWILIALPVLVYLGFHPQELWTPRGKDLVMSYGPVVLLLLVLLPVQRGQAGRIRRLSWERSHMQIMLYRDSLTRAYNRRLGEQVLQDILAEGDRAGLIMFDMDGFKAINDTFGHPVGDRVLQRVVKLCRGVLRQDECFCRWGGEEFLVIVPNVDVSRLQQLAERLRSALVRTPMEPVGQISASFGVAMIGEGESLSALMQRVDAALYRAKQRGGNCVVTAQLLRGTETASGTPGVQDEQRPEPEGPAS